MNLMNYKRRICIISFSNLKREPRVIRQINALKNKYSVTTLGLKKSEITAIKEFTITDNSSTSTRLKRRLLFLFARLFNNLYLKYNELKYPTKQIIKMLSDETFDLVIAHGVDILNVAKKIASKDNAKVLLDAHEYEPKRIEDRCYHRFFVNPYKDYLCKKHLKSLDTIITVAPGIAEEYNRVYGVKPEIIRNVPEYKNFSLKKPVPNKIHLIHHGIAHPSRQLENMIRLMPLLETRFQLTLMLVVTDKKYFNFLKELKNRICPDRVSFKAPVDFSSIMNELNHYDIGVILYKPTSFNVRHSLPNKLFEFIMTGLCIISGPSPEIKKIIEEYSCGYVSNTFKVEDIAKMINSLTIKDIQNKKKASLAAADSLNAEKEMEKFKTIVKNLIGDTLEG
jgi:glycosyltransferase involved in cell wall biosynthesis